MSYIADPLRSDRAFFLDEIKPALVAAGLSWEFDYMYEYIPNELQPDADFVKQFTALP
jgi:hypothetical protein